MTLVEIITRSWSFAGLVPRAIIDINAFGNVLVESADGRFWRICPEELSCKPVAESREELDRLRSSSEFHRDWLMQPLVDLATSTLGAPAEDHCFCLKLPAVLGGEYGPSNLGTITLTELLATSGDIARQIEDVPDGGEIVINITD
jgi:hypothetical protein